MTAEGTQFGKIDLDSCDREPIHIPGSIQPHGVLLVVESRDLGIRQFAGDTHLLLAVGPEDMASSSLSDLFDEQVIDRIAGWPLASASGSPTVLLGVASRTGRLPLDITIHSQDCRQGPISIIELEQARRGAMPVGNPLSQVRSMLAALQSSGSFETCCVAAAAQVREAIGFDRVMVYQFLHDGSGRVLAEDKADGLESFLGLHYPASDIPRQARELYRRNWLRLIPDVDYTPAPLQSLGTAQEDRSSGDALDMSCCALRAVSPIHLEYLRNMGVSASMSISIVMRGQLWGLIACHNHTPRYVTADLRASCELFAQVLSLHLEARIEADAARDRLQARSVHEALAVRLPVATDIRAALVSGEVTLLDLIPAGGVAVWLDGEFATLGETPPEDFMTGLVTWLNGLDRPLVETFHLAAVYPPALRFSAIASGMLAISLSRQPADYVIWFRPEAVHSITWAGDPRKMIEAGPSGDRLMPRKSFEAWREGGPSQSTPWSAVEIDSANAFRGWLLESVLRQVDLARKEREAALAQQDLLMAELDHRVKNTLASIQALVQQTRAGAGSVEDFSAALDRRIRAMSHAHDLMSETRWRGASVRGLVEEELAPFRSEREGSLLMAGDDLMLSPKAALPFTLVMHELVTNAAKYGALSTPAGNIEIDWRRREDEALVMSWRERGGPPVTAPTRRGFGSVVIERSLRHEIKGACTLTFADEGVACVIVIPSEYVMTMETRGT